jgi:hypothetical protein
MALQAGSESQDISPKISGLWQLKCVDFGNKNGQPLDERVASQSDSQRYVRVRGAARLHRSSSMANTQGSQNPGTGSPSNQDPSQQKGGTSQHNQQGNQGNQQGNKTNDMNDRNKQSGSGGSGSQHSGSGQQSGGAGGNR